MGNRSEGRVTYWLERVANINDGSFVADTGESDGSGQSAHRAADDKKFNGHKVVLDLSVHGCPSREALSVRCA